MYELIGVARVSVSMPLGGAAVNSIGIVPDSASAFGRQIYDSLTVDLQRKPISAGAYSARTSTKLGACWIFPAAAADEICSKRLAGAASLARSVWVVIATLCQRMKVSRNKRQDGVRRYFSGTCASLALSSLRSNLPLVPPPSLLTLPCPYRVAGTGYEIFRGSGLLDSARMIVSRSSIDRTIRLMKGPAVGNLFILISRCIR